MIFFWHQYFFSQLGEDQGISECRPSGSRRTVNYGYGELLEAAIFEEDGVTLVQKTQLLGQEGLAFKVNKEYVVRAKFSAKKFSSFGSYPNDASPSSTPT